MSGRPAEHDEQTAKDLLNRYIFYDRAATEEVFAPHGIPPKVASSFIRDEVVWDFKLEHMKHAGNIARLCLARDCVDHFASFFGERVREVVEAHRMMECVKTVGDLGDSGQQRQAGECFEQLVKDRLFEKYADPMVRTYFHMGSATTHDSIEKRLKELYQDRIRNLPDPKRPDTPTNELEALIQPMLTDCVAAKKAKERLLTGSRPDARAYGLARMFLGLDHSLFAQEWAGYAMVAEAQRSDDATVVEGVRKAYKGLEALKLSDHDPKIVAEYRKDGRSRTVDAINYFGGELTDDEKPFFENSNRPRTLFTQ